VKLVKMSKFSPKKLNRIGPRSQCYKTFFFATDKEAKNKLECLLLSGRFRPYSQILETGLFNLIISDKERKFKHQLDCKSLVEWLLQVLRLEQKYQTDETIKESIYAENEFFLLLKEQKHLNELPQLSHL
jgi:hypothetical protein